MNTLTPYNDTSPVDVDAVRTSIQAALREDGLTQKQIAAEAGVAEGTFGPWLASKYQGDNERVARQCRRWLELRDDRAAQAAVMPDPPPWQETPTARKILGILARSQTTGDLVVIGCGPGAGKSATAQQYRATRPNVHLATMRPSTRGVNTCLVAVLTAMGDPAAKGTPQALADKIIGKIAGTRALLVIDEAQHLSVQAVEELRSIHDITGCGLAFVGDERLFAIFGGSRQGEFAQLSSRIGFRLRQARPLPEDAAIIARAHGVDDARIIQVATEIAAKPGALRGLSKVLLLARQTAAVTGEPLSERLVRTAWESLAPEHAVSALARRAAS
jgi:DNA transposition AAA+ family ATPase